MGEGLGYELDVRIMRVFYRMEGRGGRGGVYSEGGSRERRRLLLLLRDSDLCRRSTGSHCDKVLPPGTSDISCTSVQSTLHQQSQHRPGRGTNVSIIVIGERAGNKNNT